MFADTETVRWTSDPAWPWSLPHVGLPALVIVGIVLAVFTVWTYLGVRSATFRRVAVVLALRLFALVLACLMLVRPSLALLREQHPPSTLLIVVDTSASMTNQDEAGAQSRWERLRQLLHDADPALKEMEDDKNVKVILYQFAEDVADYDPNAKADGKRTDFGEMLHTLYERHSRDDNLRGILVLSDGADNGTRYPALTEAARWRNIPCPVHTFALGQTTTSDQQRDIALTAIYAEPSPVAIKGKLTVRGIVDAPGFENANARVHLYVNDKEVLAQTETLTKTTGNEVRLTTDAPAVPGEIKVSLKIDPLPGEVSKANNEIGTYVTVNKEGLSVLVVYRGSFSEPQRIIDALSSDPRMRIYSAWFRGDQPPGQTDMLEFEKQHYDVIILGDVTAERLKAGNADALDQIRDLVNKKGSGLLMLGGNNTFGNGDWNNTPVADILPVELDVRGQIDEKVQMLPTVAGIDHFLLRLSDRPKDNAAAWRELPKLDGMSTLGKPKKAATVLADAKLANGSRVPMLVGQQVGKGRTLAFAGDTTWRWERLGRPERTDGTTLHHRFWKQVVLWLAQQDKIEGNAYIKPDVRRVGSGGKLGFTVGLRGPGGKELEDGYFEVTAIDPQQNEIQVEPPARDKGDVRGLFWKTQTPGEYHLRVKAWPKGADPKKAKPETAESRFIVYQDDTEMTRRGADHDFLEKLAGAGGGKFHLADEFPRFVKDLNQLPLPHGKQKAELWPDWKRNRLSGFLVGIFLLFVAVVCTEWFLRRSWGMV
jgi:uncharacterized membrane protein